MVDAARHRTMTVEEFLDWNLSQDQRYELVDGVPAPLRAMAGAKAEHDTIVVNLIAMLHEQLRGGDCKPRTADTALRTRIRNVRRPDVTVECAPLKKGTLEAQRPVAVFGVLSPTTRQLDRSVKLEEYRRHPNLRTIVHIDPDLMDVMVYTRNAEGAWVDKRLNGPEDMIHVTGTPATLPLVGVYDGVPLASAPEESRG